MKFLRVEVENWRPFRGRSSMDFASSYDRPITLVFGKNGGGKTSLLTAVYWCLYGAMDLEEGKGDQNLVNDHAVQGAVATKDNPVDAVVTTYASRPSAGTDFLYQISRRQSAWDSGGNRREAQNGLVVARVKPHAGYRTGDDVVLAFDQQGSTLERFEGSAAQDVVEKLLPQGLAKYFFYPGETLSFPFRNDKKSIGLLKGFLREISGGSKFEPFRERIKETKKKLDAKSKAHAEADRVTKGLQKSIDDIEVELAANQAELPDVEAELEAAEDNRQRVIRQLEDLDALQDVLAAAERARADERAAQLGVDAAEQALTDALSGAYLVAASPVFDAVVEVFGRRKYPSDVSSSLVEQLRESMECICGRALTTEMLERLEPLSPTDDSVITRMLTLTSHATSLRKSADDRIAVDAASVGLREAVEAQKIAIEARADAEAKLTEAGADQFEQVDKSNLVGERSRLDGEIRKLSQRLGSLQQAIQDDKAEIERKEAEKRSSAPKDHRDIHRAASIAHQMEDLLEAIADKQADVARTQLQSLINDNYVIYKNNMEAAVDSDLRVKVLDRAGGEEIEKPVGDISGAETALLTYAFAAAAAKMLPQYQTLEKLLTTTPEFAQVEHIPLVVDAPFSNLGLEYKRRVMELMAKGFSQVIMFTESADIEILEASASVIGTEYLVHFEGELADGVEQTFVWKGETYTYASEGDGAVRSTLERIEP